MANKYFVYDEDLENNREHLQSFEIAVEGEYMDTIISKVYEILYKKLPNYTRNKVVVYVTLQFTYYSALETG